MLVLGCTAGASEIRTSKIPATSELPAASFETPFIVPTTTPPVPTSAPPEIRSAAFPSGYRVSLPRLGIDLPIAEGDLKRDIDDQRTPEGFAFHLPGTAVPGQNGNTYLYAHARQGMFLTLWNARPGDEVQISAPGGPVLVYVVRDILPRVPPTDVSSTQPTLIERLTLQTSTGPSPSDPRFVVFAFPRG